jgi:hypothetical protein
MVLRNSRVPRETGESSRIKERVADLLAHLIERSAAKLGSATLSDFEFVGKLGVRIALDFALDHDKSLPFGEIDACATERVSQFELFDPVARVFDQLDDGPRILALLIRGGGIKRERFLRIDPVQSLFVKSQLAVGSFGDQRSLIARQVVEAAKLVTHLTENLRARKAPERALAAGRALATEGSAVRIPVSRCLGESFECRAFKVRELRAPRPPPVPARNPERAIHMLLSQPEHKKQRSMHFGRLAVEFVKKGRRVFANFAHPERKPAEGSLNFF